MVHGSPTLHAGRESAVAHLVQAGNARPKVRSGLGVWFLGLITGGIYSIYWWKRTASDLAEFESSDGSTSSIDVKREAGGVGALLAMIYVAQIGMRESTQGVDPFTGQVVETSQVTMAGSIVGLVAFIGMLYMAYRLRSHARRVMTKAGMLPEEQPGAVSFWLVSFFFGLFGSTGNLQAALNTLWNRYPRWYKSIGGTKDEVVGGPATAGMPVGATAPIGAPMMAAQPVPAGTPGAQPIAAPAAAGGDAAQVLAELTPRAQAGQLDAASGFRFAQAVEQLHGVEPAAQWYEFVANSDPANAHAMYWVGAYRVARNDEGGVAYLHRAAQDATFRAAASQMLAEHLERTGRHEDAARWRQYAAA